MATVSKEGEDCDMVTAGGTDKAQRKQIITKVKFTVGTRRILEVGVICPGPATEDELGNRCMQR